MMKINSISFILLLVFLLNQGNGLECDANSYEKDGVCVSCGEGSYYSTIYGVCQTCAKHGNCATCRLTSPSPPPETECLSCKLGSYMGGGYCSECRYVDGCANCDGNVFHCNSCKPGYYMKDQDNCIACASGCNTCTSSSCTGCNANYYFDVSNTCVQCPEKTYSAAGNSLTACLDCDQSGTGVCLACSNGDAGSCTSCEAGSFLSSGVCTLCEDKNCGQCSGAGTGVCTACADGFYMEGGLCKACSDKLCAVCSGAGASACTSCQADSYMSKGSCTSCAVGYYSPVGSTASSACQKCSDTNCNSCSGSGSGVCTTCASSYVLENGKCRPACEVADCTTCSSASSSTCVTCNDGFVLSSGTCQVPAADADVELESTIRYEMTMDDYSSNGGDEFFIEQTATQLEVDESLVTITSVTEGSVIIAFKIKSSGTGNKLDDLKAIKAKLDAAVASGAMKVFPGAIILDYESGFVTVTVTDSCPSGQSRASNGMCVKDGDGANVGAILGGVLGGLALIIVLILIAYKLGWVSKLNKTKSPTKYDLAKSNPTSPATSEAQDEKVAHAI